MALLLLRTVKLSHQRIRCRTVTVGQGLRNGSQRYATWPENLRRNFSCSCKITIRLTSSLGASAAHPSRTYSSYNSYSAQALSRLREACESPFPGRCPRDPFSTIRWRQFSHSSPESPDEFDDESDSCEPKGSVISESDPVLPMWNLPDSIETLPGLDNDYHLKLEAFLSDMGLTYEPRALWLRVMIHETFYQHLTQLRDSMATSSEGEEKEAGSKEEVEKEERKVPMLNLGAAHSAIRSQLELIGDNFIGLMASIYLISKNPYASKGDITVMKGEMVNNRNIAKVAKELGLLDVFRTLPPIKDFDPEVSGFESTVAANCLEIFSGATLMSEGMSATADVINRQVIPLLIAGLGSSEKMKKAVNLVQEKSHHSFRCQPTYNIMSVPTSDQSSFFQVSLNVGGVEMSTGRGLSLMEARRDAAEKALALWDDKVKQVLPGEVPPSSDTTSPEGGSDGGPGDESRMRLLVCVDQELQCVPEYKWHATNKVGDKEVVRVRLYIKGVRMPTGIGFTTAHAQEDAAKKALAEWGGKVDHLKAIPHPMASLIPSPIYVEAGGGQGEEPFVKTGEDTTGQEYLQHLVRKEFKVNPEYRLLNIGTSKAVPTIRVRAYVKGVKLSTGRGFSQSKAKEDAAWGALGYIESNLDKLKSVLLP